MRGAINPPPTPLLIGRLIPLLILLLCGADSRTVIIVPLLLPPSLLSLGDGTSVVSSVGWGVPPIGIDAQKRWRRMI